MIDSERYRGMYSPEERDIMRRASKLPLARLKDLRRSSRQFFVLGFQFSVSRILVEIV